MNPIELKSLNYSFSFPHIRAFRAGVPAPRIGVDADLNIPASPRGS